MSNSNNMGKELKRLREELQDLKAKDRRFHFLALGKNETEEAKVKEIMDAGKFSPGDEYQVVQVPWALNELRRSTHIPEGSAADPFVEPETPRPEPVGTSCGEERDRVQRWKEHIRKIERDGTRYDPDKPKRGNGVY